MDHFLIKEKGIFGAEKNLGRFQLLINHTHEIFDTYSSWLFFHLYCL